MKRTLTAAGSALAAIALVASPATAQGETILDRQFHSDSIDPQFVALGETCLTAASGDNPMACEEGLTGPIPELGEEKGYLLLTDESKFAAGGFVYNEAIEAEDGIQVRFAQYQYGGTGADGISFFLADGSENLTDVGAMGGSLGYAQHIDEPGVDGGFIGLGIDAWGNFSADTENRGNGCPADQRAPSFLQEEGNRAPDNVALRGPGEGDEGYCLLATTATEEVVETTDDGTIYGTDFPDSVRADSLEEAKRLVRLTVSGHDEPRVTVEMDFLNGAGWQTMLETTVDHEAPSSYKFGFAASTGAATDVHLLRHLSVRTLG
ncbi:L-type lectin family protein [Salininema proteolyticum]|uniref:Uncharacterized protein n=1 Tax=Salininema proteolyticum TaxID=1607685 RepID=A0ABV8TXT4_9ACTN